jgi:hypothetical protein
VTLWRKTPSVLQTLQSGGAAFAIAVGLIIIVASREKIADLLLTCLRSCAPIGDADHSQCKRGDADQIYR